MEPATMRPTAMTTTLPRIWDTSKGCAVTLGTVYRYDLGTLWGPEHASEVRYVNASQPESYGPHLMTREQLLENWHAWWTRSMPMQPVRERRRRARSRWGEDSRQSADDTRRSPPTLDRTGSVRCAAGVADEAVADENAHAPPSRVSRF